MTVASEGGDFIEAVSRNPEVRQYLTAADLKAMTNPTFYVGTAVSQVYETAKLARITRRLAEQVFRKTLYARTS
jgi:hypothetical protein